MQSKILDATATSRSYFNYLKALYFRLESRSEKENKCNNNNTNNKKIMRKNNNETAKKDDYNNDDYDNNDNKSNNVDSK